MSEMGIFNFNDYIYSDKDIYKKDPVFKKVGVVGLYNLGNTCYMNSLLQCLKNLFPLTNFVLTKKFESGKLIKEYQELLFNLISSKNEIVDASKFHEALGRIDSYFCCHEQRDSSKLFLTVLKALMDDTKDYNEMTISKNLEKEEPKLYNRYINSRKRNPSILYDFFFGFSKNISYCKKCYNKEHKINNIRYQPYSIIDLYLTNSYGKKITDLTSLIENYEIPKNSDFECSCGEKLIEKNLLGRIPPILVFKFQRSIDNKHINHKIIYPNILYMKKFSDGFLSDEHNEKNSELKFNLYGVMLHYGSANFGHKTAYTKNFIDNNWYYFNDTSKYFESEINNVLDDKEAFMLFYISDSFKISKERIQTIINLADKNSIKNNFYPKTNSYYYNKQNFTSNFNNNIFNLKNNNIDNNIEINSNKYQNFNDNKNINQNNEINIDSNSNNQQNFSINRKFINNQNNYNFINDNLNNNIKPNNNNSRINQKTNNINSNKNKYKSENKIRIKKSYY